LSKLPAFAPTVSPESKPFWDGTALGKILLPQCNDCGTVIWYPRTSCPECMSTDVDWFEASGRGTIYSFAIVRRAGGPWRDALPYVLAYVELEEGPRVLTNIVGSVDAGGTPAPPGDVGDTPAPPGELEVGQAVEAVFDDTGEGNALVRFRPS